MEGWIAVEIELDPGVDAMALDVLSGELFEAGVAGIEQRDVPPVIVAAFEPGTAPDAIRAEVESALSVANLDARRVELRAVEPIDWATHWRRNFTVMRFGPLAVVPSWLEPPADAEMILRLDPGMAFGTGSHETTALCLERLVELEPNGRVLDVGTGTAILAMAAVLRGFSAAVGTDNDPEALEVAAENLEANALAHKVTLGAKEPDEAGGPFEVVVANILKEPLIELAPRISAAVASGGHLLLSGLLIPQAEDVAAAYEAQGMLRERVATRGEWARVDLRKP